MTRLGGQFRRVIRELAGINPVVALAVLVVGTLLYYCLPAKLEGYAVAATAALFIAFVAYPWQKEKDRRLKISEESRLHCVRFVEQCLTALRTIDEEKLKWQHSTHEEINPGSLEAFQANMLSVVRSLKEERTILLLTASSQSVLVGAEKIQKSLAKHSSGLLDQTKNSPEFAERDTISQDELRDLLVRYLSDVQTQFRQDLSELVQLMRIEEFSADPIRIEFTSMPESKRDEQ